MLLHNKETAVTADNNPRVPVWLDVAVLIVCMAISWLNPVPFPWKVPIIAALIIGYIAFIHKKPRLIGLRKFDLKNAFIWGFAIALTVVVGISNIINPLLESLLNKEVDTSAYGSLEGNFSFAVNYWWRAMISAAIAEEIFYRGFLFFVLERIAGSGRFQKMMIILLTAVYFGWSHSFQGITGMVGISLAAVVFGTGFYLSRKNLYAVILAHALVDTWSLFSLYRGGISFFF